MVVPFPIIIYQIRQARGTENGATFAFGRAVVLGGVAA